MKVVPKFVDFMPEHLKDHVLYVAMDYGTVLHKCCCGCGNEVNTPLSPDDWILMFNGETITLKPSIGNWSFDCKSHYWITNSTIEWASQWDDNKIKKVRQIEFSERKAFYEEKRMNNSQEEISYNRPIIEASSKRKRWFEWLLFWE